MMMWTWYIVNLHQHFSFAVKQAGRNCALGNEHSKRKFYLVIKTPYFFTLNHHIVPAVLPPKLIPHWCNVS